MLRRRVARSQKILKNKNKPAEDVLEDFSKALCKRIIYDIIKIFEGLDNKEVFECLAEEFKKLGKNKT